MKAGDKPKLNAGQLERIAVGQKLDLRPSQATEPYSQGQ